MDKASFISALENAIRNQDLVKIVISNRVDKNNDIKQIIGKLIATKKGNRVSIIFRHQTKDITKNFDLDESLKLLAGYLTNDFLQGQLETTKQEFLYHRLPNGKVKIKNRTKEQTTAITLNHDHQKKRIISTAENLYLQKLGILTESGNIKSDKQDKYKQINKYVEILAANLKSKDLGSSPIIYDMGSGKGYLTFALHDYLVNWLKLNPQTIGIEFRESLVRKCNEIAQLCQFKNLRFKSGGIIDEKIDKANVLIALHACDTATDEAIFQGIKVGAQFIVVAPCCHRQVRKVMDANSVNAELYKHGIILERQASLLTDTMRSLIMEMYGYKTKVIEFISSTHTPKNTMIIGSKKSRIDLEYVDQKKEALNSMFRNFGIKYHHLYRLLGHQ